MSADRGAVGPGPCAACGWPPSGGAHCPSCGAPTPNAGPDPYVDLRVGDRYEVGNLLCVGGMGRVYRGEQLALGRPVAIKFIHPHLLDSREVLQRFMLEARTASRLNHPNIVRVFDFGLLPEAQGGAPYTVMELLAGPSLADEIDRQRRLPLSRAADVVLQVLAALDEAHCHGVIHRDVKPENVLLVRRGPAGDFVKVIDFGLARVDGTSRITAAGNALGTPGFMAPEQLAGAKPTPASDLYAAGVVLYEALSGRLPFAGETPTEMALAQFAGTCPDPRALVPGLALPDAVVEVLRRALQPEMDRRFGSAEEFSRALTAAVAAGSAGAPGRRSAVGPVLPPSAPAAWRPTLPELAAPAPRESPPAAEPKARTALLGREQDVAWARGWMAASRPGRAAILWGEPGAGKTSMLRELDALARAAGMRSLLVRAAPAPACLARYGGVAAVVAALLGWDASRARSEVAQVFERPEVTAGLWAMFGIAESEVDGAREPERVGQALAWAAQRAAARAPAAGVLLAIDDFDRMDSLSRRVLANWADAEEPPAPRLVITVTGPAAPHTLPRAARREIRAVPAARAGLPGGAYVGDEIAPLHLEQLRRWVAEHPREPAPAALAELVRARVEALAAEERRVLQSVALLGRADAAALRRLHGDAPVAASVLDGLARAGFVEVDGPAVSLAHAAFADPVRATMLPGVAADLHAAAAETGPLEVRVHHALRGNPDLSAYLLAERAADALAARGDGAGGAAVLLDAANAARAEWSRSGDEEAAGAWLTFARRHAELALAEGDSRRAIGLLVEVLELPACRGPVRARVLDLLANAEARRGRRTASLRYRHDARASAPPPAARRQTG